MSGADRDHREELRRLGNRHATSNEGQERRIGYAFDFSKKKALKITIA